VTARLSPDVVRRAIAGSSLEWKLTHPMAFGLTTASPLQRAICRVADGLPLGDLAKDTTVIAAFGNVKDLPDTPPDEMAIVSGIRTAKSLIASCGAFHMAVTCDVSALRPGEYPRVSVVSLKKDLSDVIMNHLVGSIKASALLRPFLMGDPTGDGLWIRHPSGMPIEVCVVAGSRAGMSLVARWSAGAIFDEFPRMVGGDDAVVNWDDQRRAVVHRMLPNAKLWDIGSPDAPYGPAYEMVTEHHGKPTRELVVVKAPAPAMNPVYWTPEKIAERRKVDPTAAKTDIDAEFRTPDEAMFSLESIVSCTRKHPLCIPKMEGHTYYAAMDPATRGNGWTLAVATRHEGKTVVARVEERVGSPDAPLDPGDVMEEYAEIIHSYGLSTVHSDQAMGDALIKLGRQHGVSIVQWTLSGTERFKKYDNIKTHLGRGHIELPPVAHVRTDLLHIRKRVTPEGTRAVLPQTSDGRHCDFGPTLMLCLSKLLPEPVEEKPKKEDDETTRMRKLVMERFAKKGNW
jgi:hypothetical protein